ncbi:MULTISPECIES: DapH/DapD/GlmU-related protein [Bacillaceae]|uniref:DapH/DapD/GlmU-related protein n=1 Tax=Shouchella oshimensis TaxID=290588 RepID=UPI0006EBED6B|nr:MULTISPECIES: DapH/DapD/GlmU-related protein [Bacillaceae]
MEIKIKDVLDLLTKSNYKFSFHGDRNEILEGFSTLFNYKKSTITFVSSLNKFEDHESLFKGSKITLIVADPSEAINSCFLNTIHIKNPKRAFFFILDNLFNSNLESESIRKMEVEDDNDHSFISKKAKVSVGVKVGINCIIEEDVVIGEGTVIHHNVVIRSGTKIGKNCTILSGNIIGETGFNPLKLDDGTRMMVRHYGGVTIGDNVFIGDNCSISKGAIDDTIIESGVKINKKVIVAHNVLIGKNTVITSPTFICGSVKIGSNCHIAASVIKNQCTIGDEAILGLGSVVVKNVESKTTVVGNPAKELI